MQINKIGIKNYKGINSAIFEFDKQFNLIIGDNNVGKTSILEAIGTALGAFILGVPNVNTKHINSIDIRRVNKLIGEGSSVTEYCLPVEIECSATVNSVDYNWKRIKSNTTSSKTKTIPHKIDKVAFALSNDISNALPIISYQSASRTWAQRRDTKNDLFNKKFSRNVGYTDCLVEQSSMKFVNN